MSSLQTDYVEQLCMLYLWTRSSSHGRSRTRETEVGWPYLRQLKTAGTHGWGMPLSMASTNGMQKIWAMNNLRILKCMHITKYMVHMNKVVFMDCFLESLFPLRQQIKSNQITKKSSSRTLTLMMMFKGLHRQRFGCSFIIIHFRSRSSFLESFYKCISNFLVHLLQVWWITCHFSIWWYI